MKKRPAGFVIDVPVTLSVHVRGKSWEEAQKIARAFAESLSPSADYIKGYSDAIDAGITEATLEATTEESCEALDELEADEETDICTDCSHERGTPEPSPMHKECREHGHNYECVVREGKQ